MEISKEAIKELRERTGAPIIECREALRKVAGGVEEAVQILSQRGFQVAQKKRERALLNGLIESYVHPGGRVGAMVEVDCETDFVGRTPEFKDLCHDLTLQIVALSPRFVSVEELPEGEDLNPEEVCLLEQPFIKDPSIKVIDLIHQVVGKLRENIRVRRFVRFELGD